MPGYAWADTMPETVVNIIFFEIRGKSMSQLGVGLSSAGSRAILHLDM